MVIVMRYVYRYLFLNSLICILSFSAAAESLDSLQTEHTRLEAVRDSLLTQRAGLVAKLDTLANQIYRLKRADTGGVAETLQRALRQTLELADRIERVDMAFEAMRTALSHLRQKLRAQYDREIGAAIVAMEKQPDTATADRLRALQRVRGALEEKGAEIRPAEVQMLVVREDDGPGEIRQKADLMEDMAAQTQVKADAVGRRIKRLEEERRLRVRMSTLRGELDFFDEAVLEGRSLSPGRAVEGTGGVLPDAADQAPEDALPDATVAAGETSERSGFGVTETVADLLESGSTPKRVVAIGREIGLPHAQTPPEVLSSDDLISEIARLKGLQKALTTREQALKRRAEAFRKYLQQMLEEGC